MGERERERVGGREREIAEGRKGGGGRERGREREKERERESEGGREGGRKGERERERERENSNISSSYWDCLSVLYCTAQCKLKKNSPSTNHIHHTPLPSNCAV